MITPDLVVVGVLAVSALVAFMRGLVREVLSIAGWLGAAVVALTFSSQVAPLVAPYLPAPEWIDPASYLILFVAALIVFSIIAKIISNAVRASVIGGVDRSLGLLFGLARGAVVLAAVYIVAGFAVPVEHWPEGVLQSRSLPYIRQVASWILPLIPSEYRPALPPSRQTETNGILNPAPAGRVSDPPARK